MLLAESDFSSSDGIVCQGSDVDFNDSAFDKRTASFCPQPPSQSQSQNQPQQTAKPQTKTVVYYFCEYEKIEDNPIAAPAATTSPAKDKKSK
mmetsp:Transcript_14318/g.19423  ORF Transcript_14318/g.19423 Transcript_14318/m.19423 type:complete len:92 (+) Transcript_14318:442-717(+)